MLAKVTAKPDGAIVSPTPIGKTSSTMALKATPRDRAQGLRPTGRGRTRSARPLTRG